MGKLILRFFTWLWATYETFTFWQWAGALPALGGLMSIVPLVGVFNEWPWWIQILASGVAALVWLTLMTWMINLFRNRPEEKPDGRVIDNRKGQIAKDVEGDVDQTLINIEGDVNIGGKPPYNIH